MANVLRELGWQATSRFELQDDPGHEVDPFELTVNPLHEVYGPMNARAEGAAFNGRRYHQPPDFSVHITMVKHTMDITAGATNLVSQPSKCCIVPIGSRFTPRLAEAF